MFTETYIYIMRKQNIFVKENIEKKRKKWAKALGVTLPGYDWVMVAAMEGLDQVQFHVVLT